MTLTEILGLDRIQELKAEAIGSSLYGVLIANITEDEQLATIGFLISSAKERDRFIQEIIEKIGPF